MPKIHCSITNCHYWKSGNECSASEVTVTSNSVGNTMPDVFNALKTSTAPETPVETNMETCCKTFVESNSPNKNFDGIYKK